MPLDLILALAELYKWRGFLSALMEGFVLGP